jgi:hypothetical protein
MAVLTLGFGTMAPAALASVSQGYAATTTIPAGSLVSLDAKSSGAVVISDTKNVGRLFGIVVPPTAATISVGGSDSNGQVQVVTTGSASAFVTTTNGDIEPGDYITVSAIAGVGQKATGKTRVIGTAQASFSATSEGVTKRTVEDTTGAKREVAIGEIPITIAAAAFNGDGTEAYTVPSWLQSLSNTLAGKAVSPVRVIVAALILMTALISITVLLYGAVRNSIIAIGRNPLSKSSVLKGLLQVGLISMVILGAAGGAMYLVIAR